ncbi:chitinase-3-like protein 2 [Coccinella septempunctata]|uniref:chitinase-3-like protein 2 n=1 Tax=Coccinella septempunctata TaxID=41139 RepID=UPI001D06B7E6|nr:chitinase-3-like protein 2 [Coccinella septempunctata]
MVAIHYDFQKDVPTFIGEIRKPKQNFVIPVVFLLCLTGTFALIILYLYHNEQLQSLRIKTRNAVPTRLVCYYNFPGTNDLQPKDIDAFLCTHIIVGFLNVNTSHEIGVSETQVEILQRVNDLKVKNPHLKVLVSVGGAGNTKGWSGMVSNHINRKRFIKSTRIFLKNYELDGIDLDWEYPNDLGVNNKERIHFTQLLEEFRSHINRNSYKFLLSVAVPSSSFRVDISYQVNYLNQFTDFVNLMSYDFHFFSNLTPFTGLNAPLLRSSLDNGIFASLNINDTVNYYLEKGMDKNKINVGLPTYGHTFTLFNEYNNGLYSPARGYGSVGFKGFATYPEICKFLKANRIRRYFDSITKSPYATKGLEWISFDDDNSLALKVQFLKEKGFGGIMTYSLNSDDYRGEYGNSFTLTKAVKSILE